MPRTTACSLRAPVASRAALLIAALLTADSLSAQGLWVRRKLPSSRIWHRAVHDQVRGRTLIFGGFDGQANLGDMWAFDGRRWQELTLPNAPTARLGFMMVYDSLRDRVVLFGGDDGSLQSDTWEFDGTTWNQVNTANSPLARSEHAMAFDSVRGETVLFGGADANGNLRNDRWVYNGTNWTQASGPAGSRPPARMSHAMAFDAARARIVLFGGQTLTTPLADTWEHDGTSWTQITVTGTPPPTHTYHAMTYDSARHRVVVSGGTGATNATLEYNGAQWLQVNTPTGPGGRELPAMAFDNRRNRCVLFGGDFLSDTWEYDGANWVEIGDVSTPPQLYESAMVFDSIRSNSVLFGGAAQTLLADTWTYDGATFTHRHPATSPVARSGHAMAFDYLRNNTIMFGGGGGTGVGFLGDTWAFDGTNWTQVLAASPPARTLHAMAFDIGSASVILFGGFLPGGNAANDTWLFDGSTWSQVLGAGPPGRFDHAMENDMLRARTVLFGGRTSFSNPPLADTWEFNGLAWLPIGATGAPPARTNHSLAFDMPRQRILLFGGETTTGALDDLWSYDGTAWTAITATGPSVRHSHAMTYDTSRDHLVVFGGLDGAALGDTWEYHPSTGTASHSLYGSGCAGSNGVPSLTATSLPLIGDWFSIALANGRANTIAASVVGFSDTQWGAVPLPLPLAGIGAPGCTLLTSIDQTDLFPIDNFGNGSLSLRVPNSNVLLGLVFFHQCAVLDPVNALGLVVSNAGRGTLGNQ